MPESICDDIHFTPAWINIAPYLPKPLYARKVSLSQEFALRLPGGSTKMIRVIPRDLRLESHEGYIQLSSNVLFQ